MKRYSLIVILLLCIVSVMPADAKIRFGIKVGANVTKQNTEIEKFELDVCLDLGNAAVSAISTGAANAILGMVLSKYDDNILCEAKYNIYPGYTGDGVKIKTFIKLSIKVSDIIKMLLKKQKVKGGIKNGKRKSSN